VHDIIVPRSPGYEVESGDEADPRSAFGGQTGKHVLILSLTGFDPTATLEQPRSPTQNFLLG